VRCPFAQSGKKDNTVRSGKCQSLYIFKSTCAELDNTFGSEVHGLDGDEPGENEGHQDGGAHEAEGEHVEALLGEDVGEGGYILVDLLDHRQRSFVFPHHRDGCCAPLLLLESLFSAAGASSEFLFLRLG